MRSDEMRCIDLVRELNSLGVVISINPHDGRLSAKVERPEDTPRVRELQPVMTRYREVLSGIARGYRPDLDWSGLHRRVTLACEDVLGAGRPLGKCLSCSLRAPWILEGGEPTGLCLSRDAMDALGDGPRRQRSLL